MTPFDLRFTGASGLMREV